MVILITELTTEDELEYISKKLPHEIKKLHHKRNNLNDKQNDKRNDLNIDDQDINDPAIADSGQNVCYII